MSLAAKNVLQHYVVSTSLLKFPTCEEVRSKIENAAIDLMGSNESVPSVDRMKMLACSWHRVYLRYLTEYVVFDHQMSILSLQSFVSLIYIKENHSNTQRTQMHTQMLRKT